MTFSNQALQPIYNLPVQYKQGGKITWGSNTTLLIDACLVRGSFDNLDINLGDYFGSSAQTTLNAATNGLNGLDTGALAASTIYYVYVIADQAGYNAAGVLLSTSATAPTLPNGIFPSNYNAFARIGYAITDASSHLMKLVCVGTGTTVEYYYDTPLIVLNAGASATQAAISLATSVPPVDGIAVMIGTDYGANAVANTAKLCYSGGTIASSKNVITGQVVKATAHLSPNFILPAVLISGVPKIDYILSSASDVLSVWVNGFVDYLL